MASSETGQERGGKIRHHSAYVDINDSRDLVHVIQRQWSLAHRTSVTLAPPKPDAFLACTPNEQP